MGGYRHDSDGGDSAAGGFSGSRGSCGRRSRCGWRGWLTLFAALYAVVPAGLYVEAAADLESFDVDMTYGTLTLSFSETMWGKVRHWDLRPHLLLPPSIHHHPTMHHYFERHATPHHATPRRAAPRHATPRHTTPHARPIDIERQRVHHLFGE